MAKTLQEMIDESINGSEKEPVKEIKKAEEKPVEKPKTIKNVGRGFNTLQEAIDFSKSERFEQWDNAAKKEFNNWLKKIKED